MIGYMNPTKQPFHNNDRLRTLIAEAGVTQAAALVIFNKVLGVPAYLINTFKAFLVRSDATKFRPLKNELLDRAWPVRGGQETMWLWMKIRSSPDI